MSPLWGDATLIFTQPHRGDIFVAPSLRDIILLQVSFDPADFPSRSCTCIPAGSPSPKKVSLHEFAKESHGIIHHGAVFIGVEHIQ